MAMKNRLLTVALATLTALTGLAGSQRPSETPLTVGIIERDDADTPAMDSFYTTHTFYLELSEEETVSTYEWRYLLKDSEGEWQLIATSDTPTLTIEQLEAVEGYYINADKELEGKIECSYAIDEATFYTTPLLINLNLKPVIISIEDLVLDREPYTFRASFTVNYLGSDNVEVEAEEEYTSNVKWQMFNEPLIAHCTTRNINSLYWSWITVTVRNEYGKVSQTMEFPPYDPGAGNSVSCIEDDRRIKVFNTHGTVIYEGLDSEFSSEGLPRGLYILSVEDRKTGEQASYKFSK